MKRQTQPATGLMTCHCFPRLTKEQERALIDRARAGEDVREQVILSLQRRVHALAGKYAQPEAQEEFCDLVNSANVALLKSYTRAVNSPNPYAYLLRTARSTMINYFYGYGEHTQRERVPVLSLDTSSREDGTPLSHLLSTEQTLEQPASLQEATFAFLRQAVADLPEKQRLVVERHYGFGQAPESLNTIKGGSSPKNSRSMDARYQHNKALASLRTILAPMFLTRQREHAMKKREKLPAAKQQDEEKYGEVTPCQR
jgi:RNA polymerase sigma factor (sigma-70 family)